MKVTLTVSELLECAASELVRRGVLRAGAMNMRLFGSVPVVDGVSSVADLRAEFENATGDAATKPAEDPKP